MQKKFIHGRKNSDMVGKIPTWSEKFRHGWKKDREGYMQAILTKPLELKEFVSLVLVPDLV